MTAFQSAEEAKRVFDLLFERLLEVPESNRQFSSASLRLGIRYSNPDYSVDIDGTQTPAVLGHEPSPSPDVQIIMSSEVAHSFWMGEVNVPMAMMKGKIKIKGPASTAMKLMPAIEPGHSIYPEVIKELGLNDLG